MGLWFWAPRPKGYLPYALVLLREAVVMLGGLVVLMVLPWP